MTFIFSESGWSYLERMTYRGAIGIFYNDTLSGVLAYLLFALICIMAIIGIIATIKFLGTFLFKAATGKRGAYRYYKPHR